MAWTAGNESGKDRRIGVEVFRVVHIAQRGRIVNAVERNQSLRLIPIALAQDTGQEHLGDKDGLRVLSDAPLNAETPALLLDDDIIPTSNSSSV